MLDPILIQIGPFAIHWYGLMYMLSFLGLLAYLHYSKISKEWKLTQQQKDGLWMGAFFGVVLGGRLGYVVFYNLSYFLQNPLKIPAIWEGGMSFHGGLLGVLAAIAIWAKATRHSLLKTTDWLVLLAPWALMLGRLGNFINSELYGRISESGKWCLNFPTDPLNCRYPSQLFEAVGEGPLLFLLVWWASRKLKTRGVATSSPGLVSAAFLAGYGLIRFILEFWREPDVQIGYFWNVLTEGQLFSLAMLVAGVILARVMNRS